MVKYHKNLNNLERSSTCYDLSQILVGEKLQKNRNRIKELKVNDPEIKIIEEKIDTILISVINAAKYSDLNRIMPYTAQDSKSRKILLNKIKRIENKRNNKRS